MNNIELDSKAILVCDVPVAEDKTLSAGQVVRVVEFLDAELCMVEARIPDEQLVGRFRFETAIVELTELESQQDACAKASVNQALEALEKAIAKLSKQGQIAKALDSSKTAPRPLGIWNGPLLLGERSERPEQLDPTDGNDSYALAA